MFHDFGCNILKERCAKPFKASLIVSRPANKFGYDLSV